MKGRGSKQDWAEEELEWMQDWESCGQHHKELSCHYYHNVHIRSKKPGIYISNSLSLQCKLLQEWLDLGKMALCPWADQEGVDSCRLPDDHTAFWAASPSLKGDWVAHLHILCSQSLLSFLLERLPCVSTWSIQSFKIQRLFVLALFAPYIHEITLLLCYFWICLNCSPYLSELSFICPCLSSLPDG